MTWDRRTGLYHDAGDVALSPWTATKQVVNVRRDDAAPTSL